MRLVGAPPPPEVIRLATDQGECWSEPTRASDALVLSPSRGVKNAVVFIGHERMHGWRSPTTAQIDQPRCVFVPRVTIVPDGVPRTFAGAKGPAPKPAQKPALDQKGCRFNPHVLVVPAGAEMDILNSDGILHNIDTFSSANASINKAQPKFKKVMTEKFDKPEVVKVQCDVHGWMQGWIVVGAHAAYAVSDDSGAFKLDNVPPGKHKVEVWHETLGKLSQEVEVKAGAPTKVTFEMSKK